MPNHDRFECQTAIDSDAILHPEILETKIPEKEINRMTKNTRFSPEVRQRTVRMVLESQGE